MFTDMMKIIGAVCEVSPTALKDYIIIAISSQQWIVEFEKTDRYPNAQFSESETLPSRM